MKTFWRIAGIVAIVAWAVVGVAVALDVLDRRFASIDNMAYRAERKADKLQEEVEKLRKDVRAAETAEPQIQRSLNVLSRKLDMAQEQLDRLHKDEVDRLLRGVRGNPQSTQGGDGKDRTGRDK